MNLNVKKLNNSAALYIESGQYDQAISQLKKALCLIKQSSDTDYSVTSKNTSRLVCRCDYCILEECMVCSEDSVLSETKLLSTVHVQANKKETNDYRSDYYIYRRPIRATPNCLFEGHHMGLFLLLFVRFNLALAHHLKFVSIFVYSTNSNTAATTNSVPIMEKRSIPQKVLRLYELTYTLQTDLFSTKQHQLDATICTRYSTSASVVSPGLRFNMIICNNLSQVHKISQNHEQHKNCLQRLLSMLMYVVDLEQEATYSNSISSDEQEYRQAVLLSSSSPLTILPASLPLSRRRDRKWLCMDLDGFLQNTISIILHDNCAAIA